MSDPQRLLDGADGTSEEGLALLRASKSETAPPAAKERLLAKLGLSGGAATNTLGTTSTVRSKPAKPLKGLGKATMFDSVLNRGQAATSRFGRGAVFSTAIHIALLGVAVYVGSRPSDPRKKDVSVTFVAEAPPTPAAEAPPPPPPPPPPPSRRSRPKVDKVEVKDPDPEVVKKPDTIVEAKEEAGEKPVDVAETTPKGGEDGDDNGGVEGGVEGGVKGGVVGGVIGGQLGSKTPVPTNVVIPFGAGMDRPTMVSGADPTYTKEALAARVEGLMIVRCTITVTGAITNCRAIKTLPHMEQAVIAALQNRRYSPVMYQGRPTAVDYVFNIKLVLPTR